MACVRKIEVMAGILDSASSLLGPAGMAGSTYSSTTSQVAADNLAIADVTANKQAYANTNGTCSSDPKGILRYYGKTIVRLGKAIKK